MAKRGEKRPWQVRYEWSNGIKGTESFISESDAIRAAEKIADAAEWRDDDATVSVEVVDRRG